MKRVRLFFVLVLCWSLVGNVWAEDFWVKKPYSKWSPDETRRMLEASPWSTTVKMGGAVGSGGGTSRAGIARGGTGTGDPLSGGNSQPGGAGMVVSGAGAVDSEGDLAADITYTVQFRSAAPVRQALIRSAQLQMKYDSMAEAQKSSFDTNASKFLTASFPDRILVCITFKASNNTYQSSLREYWRNQSVAKLNQMTFLNIGREKLTLLDYGFKDDTIQMAFARPKEITQETEVSLEFHHPNVGPVREQRLQVNFKPKKMILGSEVVI